MFWSLIFSVLVITSYFNLKWPYLGDKVVLNIIKNSLHKNSHYILHLQELREMSMQ